MGRAIYGYKLFASGFSYEKIRDEIEAARVEYSGKIHKVFSDIQNQLLGIPVATIVVATQMKERTFCPDSERLVAEFFVRGYHARRQDSVSSTYLSLKGSRKY